MNIVNWQEFNKVICIFPKLILGLFLCGFGIVTMLQSNIGLDPWGTLNAGLVIVTPVTFGQWSQIIGLGIIFATFFMEVVPGIATLLNIGLIGVFMDVILAADNLRTPENLLFQMLMNLAGLVTFCFGVYLYLSCDLGAGPRDGLMIALMKITGRSVTVIKTSIEVTVTLLGVFLGGPLGIGTILVALLGGKILDAIFRFMNFDPKEQKQINLLETFQLLTSQSNQ